jgi:HlyD family secretion protein
MSIKFLKNPITIVILASIIGLSIGAYAYFNSNKKQNNDGLTVARMNLSQEVAATGKIKPAENVDLAFERGGKISGVYAKVGDRVEAGKVLLSTESSDYSAQVAQAQAILSAQEAKLAELRRGSRPEELQIQESTVTNADLAKSEAQRNIETVKNKAAASLDEAYNNLLASSQDGAEYGKTALYFITDLQYAHYSQFDQKGIEIANAKEAVILEFLGQANASNMAKEFIGQLKGGTYGQVLTAIGDSSQLNIENSGASIISSLRKIKSILDTIPVNDILSASEKSNLDLTKNTINTKISVLTAKQKAIEVQKTTNSNNIATAEAALVTANNNLTSAKDGLTLKKAGTAIEQIRAQEAQVAQARASVQNAAAQLSKTLIKAPISGTISRLDIKAGEIISPMASVVSMISDGQFEIETNISETDIAKVKVGDSAKVTIDAYGNDTLFEAVVTQIDPAETLVNDVAAYKVTLQFKLNDERIKSGMTANIKLNATDRQNVLAVPESAIVTRGSDKFVLINNGSTSPEQRKVVTGIKGVNGYTEIISGLNEGERVINFGNNQ